MEFLHRTWAEIDVDALVHNFGIIKKEAAGTKIMAVVKADAYGHSARNVAPLLEAEGADAFAVSNIEEAVTLRGCGITKPILILGYTPVSMASQLYINDITQSVYSPEYAAALSKKATADKVRIKIHIKLDTGMSRIGFDCRDNSLHAFRRFRPHPARRGRLYRRAVFALYCGKGALYKGRAYPEDLPLLQFGGFLP